MKQVLFALFLFIGTLSIHAQKGFNYYKDFTKNGSIQENPNYNLPCPATRSTSEKLNATYAVEVTSFVFFTNYEKKIIVGSPAILDKANNLALIKTLLLGWWGIPWGFIRTIQA